MKRICSESTNCARLKGNHMFAMTVQKVKAFHTIVLVHGYAGLPRQETHRERREECHNLLVSAIITKTELLECKRYLYLADHSAASSWDKFSKARPLFNAINKQCILNYQPTQHVSIDQSMVPYFGEHGVKQYIHSKPITFGFQTQLCWSTWAQWEMMLRWKDNKVVNAISTFTGKQTIQQRKHYCHREKRRVDIEQPNIINQFNMSMRGVDCMDQNILYIELYD